MQSRGVLTRRALLGLVGLSIAGCTTHHKPRPPAPAVTPDAAALVTARTIEQALLASYDAKITQASAPHRALLQVARAVHVTHLAALQGTPSSPAPSTTPTATPSTAAVPAVGNIRRALHDSVNTLRGLSLAASDGTNAALFASIAASHETSAQ